MFNEETDENQASFSLFCDPKYVWFSFVFSLGIKTHACDKFSHFLIGYRTYELLMSSRIINEFQQFS